MALFHQWVGRCECQGFPRPTGIASGDDMCGTGYVWNKPSMDLCHQWGTLSGHGGNAPVKHFAGVTRRRFMHTMRWWILAVVILLLALSTLFAPPSGRPKRPVDAWRKIKPPPPPPVPRGR